MDTTSHWMRLAHLLRRELEGQPIDRQQAASLAEMLAPLHPDMTHTLSSVRRRMRAQSA
ncbi:hypothetical protein [Magnetospirillum sp. UT-4]|uniref:hypothetical protein n=1 Tax=Magnetospirillum sp. UT-4 TaxID=2681467 RepID=UPI00137E7139|nr:hypothetical protein [Magnetospirillum sp. UT-4]CAA7624600.1 conserved hypothetical protein [Magnetospirillum sp. UT-4]